MEFMAEEADPTRGKVVLAAVGLSASDRRSKNVSPAGGGCDATSQRAEFIGLSSIDQGMELRPSPAVSSGTCLLPPVLYFPPPPQHFKCHSSKF